METTGVEVKQEDIKQEPLYQACNMVLGRERVRQALRELQEWVENYKQREEPK